MGGVRENEDWTILVDAGEYSPVLGDSFNNFARYGLSFQRSQTSGRYTPQAGPSPGYYKLLQSRLPAGSAAASAVANGKEKSFFDGIDTHLAGLPALVGRPSPGGAALDAITKADFEGWVEQRGSKFWASWDAAYTPLVATFDKGQAPQPGGWLHARHGKGHYTYFAYAFHRQLPYGVPGAFRLLANLLSLGKGTS